MIDYRRVNGKDALHALAEADLANGDGFSHAAVMLGDHGALKRLQALLVAFLDLDVHADGVAGAELGVIRRPLVFIQNFGQHCVLHKNSFSTNLGGGAWFSPVPPGFAISAPPRGFPQGALPAPSSRETRPAAYTADNRANPLH